jgi:hypothetical protein
MARWIGVNLENRSLLDNRCPQDASTQIDRSARRRLQIFYGEIEMRLLRDPIRPLGSAVAANTLESQLERERGEVHFNPVGTVVFHPTAEQRGIELRQEDRIWAIDNERSEPDRQLGHVRHEVNLRRAEYVSPFVQP